MYFAARRRCKSLTFQQNSFCSQQNLKGSILNNEREQREIWDMITYLPREFAFQYVRANHRSDHNGRIELTIEIEIEKGP